MKKNKMNGVGSMRKILTKSTGDAREVCEAIMAAVDAVIWIREQPYIKPYIDVEDEALDMQVTVWINRDGFAIAQILEVCTFLLGDELKSWNGDALVGYLMGDWQGTVRAELLKKLLVFAKRRV